VTSSQNCTLVLKAAKLHSLFHVRVDGNTIETEQRGKTRRDTFLVAARLLGVQPARAVVIEDAISGVEAALMEISGL
jgi:HAD superfamily hydrolase (TIGR01509 family)